PARAPGATPPPPGRHPRRDGGDQVARHQVHLGMRRVSAAGTRNGRARREEPRAVFEGDPRRAVAERLRDTPANAAAHRSVPALTSDTVVRTRTCPARAAGRGTSSTRGALRPSRITEFIAHYARSLPAQVRPPIPEGVLPAL